MSLGSGSSQNIFTRFTQPSIHLQIVQYPISELTKSIQHARKLPKKKNCYQVHITESRLNRRHHASPNDQSLGHPCFCNLRPVALRNFVPQRRTATHTDLGRLGVPQRLLVRTYQQLHLSRYWLRRPQDPLGLQLCGLHQCRYERDGCIVTGL